MSTHVQSDADMEAKMLAAICECRKRYEQNCHDAFLSTVLHSQYEQMQKLLEEWKVCTDRDALAKEWEARCVRAKESAEEEDRHPTFDAYNEHYYAELYIGEQDAYEAMFRLLQGGENAETEGGTPPADADSGSL